VKFSVIVPTYNPGVLWDSWIKALEQQSMQPEKVLVIDSSSDDETVARSRQAGFDVFVIPREEFNHGATRQLAADMCPSIDVLVFLTQDSIFASPNSLENIVSAFGNLKVGLSYGRQLPRKTANPIESHARIYNYPDKSAVRGFQDKRNLGMKTAFASNSFAAYRSEALREVGGFPDSTIVSEDMYVAARMLIHGWYIAYCSDSTVYHSHDYSWFQEFQRYFDIGVFNARESWIRREFGSAESEGGKFVKSELRYLLAHNPLLIPEALLRTCFKLLGYRLGLAESGLPLGIKRAFSMQKAYWRRQISP